MTNHQLALTPRRIWLALTIPGKKMMRMREPSGSVDSTIEVVRRNGGLAGADEHHWTARHVLPNDDNQTVEIHYLVYDINSGK